MKSVSFLKIAVGILYILLVLSILLNPVIRGLPEGFERVDPEIINGLLAASSVLFGFCLVPSRTKRADKFLFALLFSDLFLLIWSGAMIFDFGMGRNNGLSALLFATASLAGNGLTALYRHASSLD